MRSGSRSTPKRAPGPARWPTSPTSPTRSWPRPGCGPAGPSTPRPSGCPPAAAPASRSGGEGGGRGRGRGRGKGKGRGPPAPQGCATSSSPRAGWRRRSGPATRHRRHPPGPGGRPRRPPRVCRAGQGLHTRPGARAARLPAPGAGGAGNPATPSTATADDMTTPAAPAALGTLTSRIIALHEMLDSLGVPHQFGGAARAGLVPQPEGDDGHRREPDPAAGGGRAPPRSGGHPRGHRDRRGPGAHRPGRPGPARLGRLLPRRLLCHARVPPRHGAVGAHGALPRARSRSRSSPPNT